MVHRGHVPAYLPSRTSPDPIASWKVEGTPGRLKGAGRREQSVSRFVKEFGPQLIPRSKWGGKRFSAIDEMPPNANQSKRRRGGAIGYRLVATPTC